MTERKYQLTLEEQKRAGLVATVNKSIHPTKSWKQARAERAEKKRGKE